MEYRKEYDICVIPRIFMMCLTYKLATNKFVLVVLFYYLIREV